MTHALKAWPEYFRAVEEGAKTFEIRKDDRFFKLGETILLQEWDDVQEKYTGKELKKVISYILRDCSKFGLKTGFVILGLKEEIY